MIALLSAGLATAGIAFAQKAAVPKQPNNVALADDRCVELLLLMDTDQKGKISNQDWMKFMEKEFDRLDQSKTGQVDPKLLQTKVAKHIPANTGK